MYASSNRSAATDALNTIKNATPFHSGIIIPNGSTPSEVVSELGLNWQATKVPMYLSDGREVASHQAMLRDDNADVLSIVGVNYKPMQNEFVFTNFLNILNERSLKMNYAGVLHDGRTYWAAARYENVQIVLDGGDVIHPYLLLFHSHKPGNSLRVVYSLMRFVCSNALHLILNDTKDNVRQRRSDGDFSYSVYHNQNLDPFAFDAMAHQIDTMSNTYQLLKPKIELLSRTPIEDPHDYFVRAVGKPNKSDDEQPKAVANVELLFNGQGIGSQLRAAKNTYWGALNAVTEYIDHHAGRSDNTRTSSAMLGRGRIVKFRAFKMAVNDAEAQLAA